MVHTCEYCNIDFEGSGKQFGAHKTNCKSNPKRIEINQKQTDGIRRTLGVSRFSFEEQCKCGSRFTVVATAADHKNGKYRKTCSVRCGKSNNHRYDRLRTGCLFCDTQFSTGSQWNKKFCNAKCQQEWYYLKCVDLWKDDQITGGRDKRGECSANFIRRYLFEKYNSRCSECDWCKVNQFTGKIPLQVHHVDGNSRNHKEDNLELLCPSCHSLTPTYGSRNKGNGRKYRR